MEHVFEKLIARFVILGFAWIVIGACLAGGVHDFVVLLASVRQDGKSLPQIARNTLGPISGMTTTVATLF